ncbi:nicotinate-nucleotide--dimethylbenzimidazole phosphoribosyltransferase [Arvimicrobium flavum]|uniref:nicotinate-nucleotide--dimethylbenzimidazole phosphoribosyltransferase n=1 Tax=Arvimicrobium flavum TaxID=3393320 RepID=UPI00237BC962|nr:nicotinate-nucleotide--dimethylbenzimidazole phosphoribosyltransferase [Mesorhizobium shangrilense]
MTTALPFDDFRSLLDNLPGADTAGAERVRDMFKRRGVSRSLAPIVELAAWLGAWSGRPPAVTRPVVAIFAGTHGVTQREVSPRPASPTQEAVEMLAAGGAAVNQVCLAHDLGLKVFDLALDLPTEDISVEAALDEKGCAATMAFGMEAIAGGMDLVCVGDLANGNSTVAAALFAATLGGKGADWAAAEHGVDQATAVGRIDAALALHGAHLRDPFEALRRVGGREFAAIAGAILAARMEKIPVIIDGFAATAAAAVLHRANPGALDHCRLACLSNEPSHLRAAERLGLRPILGLPFGEPGVGGGLAAGVVKAAALTYSGMAAALT